MKRRNIPILDLDEHAICHRDQPLTGSWKLLGHCIPGKVTGRRGEKEQAATNILYGELLVTYRVDPERWVSYSRRRDFYAHRTRYWAEPLSYTTVMRFIEREARGNVENKSSSPGQRGTQSRMRLSATAAQRFEHGGARLVFCPPEIVILRDVDKKLIDYTDNDETRLFVLICLRSTTLWPQPN